MVLNVGTMIVCSVADRGDVGLCPVNVPLTCYTSFVKNYGLHETLLVLKCL